MPLVSVVIPSYNHAPYIAETIESVLGQSLSDLELIIVDDASIDDSVEIIRSFESKDDRIRCIVHPQNQGIARSFNDGIAMAKGQFLAIFSSDDVWAADKLEKQLRVLEDDEDLVVWTDGLLVDTEGAPTGKTIVEHIHYTYKRKKSGDILDEALTGCFIYFPSVVAKTENVRALGFDEAYTYLNDVKLGIELAKRYEYHFISEHLVKYRMHDSNCSRMSNIEEWARDARLFRNWFLEEFGRQKSRWCLGWTGMLVLQADWPKYVAVVNERYEEQREARLRTQQDHFEPPMDNFTFLRELAGMLQKERRLREERRTAVGSLVG